MEPVLEFQDECIEEKEQDDSTQFLQTQQIFLLKLWSGSLGRILQRFPVSDFNSAKFNINLIKSYLLPLLVIERGIEPIVIKKINQFVSSKFGDVQLLDILNFLGGAMSLNSFSKAYKTSETEGYFPSVLFDEPQKVNNLQLPPYETFLSKLRNNNPLGNDYSDFQSLIDGGLTSKEALSKLKLKQPPATGQEYYQYLTTVWQQENMRTFKDFLRWYNSEDVVPTPEAVKKLVDFYHNKRIDMLKIRCNLPNLANICVHMSTTANFYPLTQSDKVFLAKIREDMVGGTS